MSKKEVVAVSQWMRVSRQELGWTREDLFARVRDTENDFRWQSPWADLDALTALEEARLELLLATLANICAKATYGGWRLQTPQ